jgi:hypothetical protein
MYIRAAIQCIFSRLDLPNFLTSLDDLGQCTGILNANHTCNLGCISGYSLPAGSNVPVAKCQVNGDVSFHELGNCIGKWM